MEELLCGVHGDQSLLHIQTQATSDQPLGTWVPLFESSVWPGGYPDLSNHVLIFSIPNDFRFDSDFLQKLKLLWKDHILWEAF